VPLVIAEPVRVVAAIRTEVWRQEGVDPIIARLALQRDEPDALQERVARRVGENLLLDPIAALPARIRQSIRGDSLREILLDRLGVPLLFREEPTGTGHDQSQVSSAREVRVGIIDLVEDAVAEGDPDPAGSCRRAPDPALGARCPPGRDSGMPGCFVDQLDHRMPSEVLETMVQAPGVIWDLEDMKHVERSRERRFIRVAP